MGKINHVMGKKNHKKRWLDIGIKRFIPYQKQVAYHIA